MYEISTREIESQQYLTEARYGTVDGLSDWTGPAIGRGWERAAKYGGVVGPVLLVFHGQVSPEEAATVEVCVPVGIDQVLPASEPHRVDPAHMEAFTRLRKSQAEFPEILKAYDAVGEWVMAHGKSFVAAPREVYFTDFMNAAPDDEALDVAFPIS